MTPTATKTNVNDELAQLGRERERTHAEARAARRDRESYDEGTQQLREELGARQSTHPEEFEGAEKRIKPDTGAAELHARIRERLLENPHAAEYEVARDAFHVADTAVNDFRNHKVPELLAERDPDFEHVSDRFRAAAEEMLDACTEYRGLLNGVRADISSTPVLARQPGMFSEDGRVETWARMAAEIIASGVARPGLSDAARVRLDRLG